MLEQDLGKVFWRSRAVPTPQGGIAPADAIKALVGDPNELDHLQRAGRLRRTPNDQAFGNMALLQLLADRTLALIYSPPKTYRHSRPSNSKANEKKIPRSNSEVVIPGGVKYPLKLITKNIEPAAINSQCKTRANLVLVPGDAIYRRGHIKLSARDSISCHLIEAILSQLTMR